MLYKRFPKPVFVRLAAGAALLAAVSGNAQEQGASPREQSWGAGLAAVAGANGYGIRFEAGAFYAIERNAFRMGVLFQGERKNLSGASLRWHHTLIRRDHKHKLELYSFADAIYNFRAYLSAGVLETETVANLKDRFKAENYAFSSVEFWAGVCLNWHITDRLQWLNGAGLGMYHTLNDPGKMYYERSGGGPAARTELIVRLSR